jgi:hypothetical protein
MRRRTVALLVAAVLLARVPATAGAHARSGGAANDPVYVPAHLG